MLVPAGQLPLAPEWLAPSPNPAGGAARGRLRGARRAPPATLQLAIPFGARRPERLDVGDRLGDQTVIGLEGELAVVRCDCGDVRRTLWRKLLQRGSERCVRCAARTRARGRSMPASRWYVDATCLDVLRAHPSGASLEEIAAVYGMARESVRQIEAAAKYHLAELLGVSPARLAELLEAVRRRHAMLRREGASRGRS